MNKVIISGRFTREPEIRRTTNKDGQPIVVSRGTIAVNRRGKQVEGEQNADFISIVAFGSPAEFIEKWAHQGMKFDICGRIQTGSYADRDGRRVYTTDVIVEEIEFAESKNSGSGQSREVRSEGNQENVQNAGTNGDGFMSILDGIEDGLPFNK